MPDNIPISKLLSQFGLSKTLQKIKFGGIVGKQTLLGIIGVTVLASIAWRADPKYAFAIALLAVAVLLSIAIMNYRFADKHPAEAMLEGTEMLAFQHQVMAAKSVEVPQNAPIIPNPGGAPPQLNPPDEIE